jgi:hypothetical protein
LPELAARPVRATDARQSRELRPQPALRVGTAQRNRLKRLLPAAAVTVAVMVLAAVNYLQVFNAGNLPAQWQASLPKWEWAQRPVATAKPQRQSAEPQQATLGQHNWSAADLAEQGETVTDAELTEALATPSVIDGAATQNAASTTALELPEAEAVNPGPVVAAPEVAKPVPVPTVAAKVAAMPAEAPAVANSSAPTAKPVSAPAAKAANTGTTTIKTRTGRFYVVSAAFRSLPAAQKSLKVLERTGRPGGRIIMPPFGSRLYRLSVADFADRASAEQEARRLRAQARSTNSHLVYPY